MRINGIGAFWVQIFGHKKTSNLRYSFFCGKGGIRTPGASQHGGFQDRCNRPLYHLSSAFSRGLLLKSDAKVDSFFESCKWIDVFFVIKGKNTNFAPNKMRFIRRRTRFPSKNPYAPPYIDNE